MMNSTMVFPRVAPSGSWVGKSMMHMAKLLFKIWVCGQTAYMEEKLTWGLTNMQTFHTHVQRNDTSFSFKPTAPCQSTQIGTRLRSKSMDNTLVRDFKINILTYFAHHTL
jgi:hypothetical protein